MANPKAVPNKSVAVVACMDVRLDPMKIFGFNLGEAHIMRNAGGVVTDDVLRSLAISQSKMDTKEIWLLHHTDCGMLGLDNEEFLDELEASTGVRPGWNPHGFQDVEKDVVDSYQKLVHDPHVDARRVRGFIFDVHSGQLHEISLGGKESHKHPSAQFIE
ncbi:MAG: beta-class carbonic anhydrase [Candidatus Dormibacteria bacterium]